MSEHSGEPLPGSFDELAETVALTVSGIVRCRDYLGRKAAREAMGELGLSNALDETGEAALEEMMGTAITSGIVLSMRGTTEPEDIDNEVARLNSQLPVPLLRSVGRLTPLMVPRGIAFHRDEIKMQTPKIAQWTEEFELLHAADQ